MQIIIKCAIGRIEEHSQIKSEQEKHKIIITIAVKNS